jgi:NodT family efflux transporter outer membrane factor (OMF) lipoprotein
MKKNYSLFTIILIAFLFTNCVTKKYTRPELSSQAHTYRNVEPDTANFATVNWRTFFADPYLIALIDTALHNNFDIKKAESQIRAANEYLKRSKASFAPSIGVNLGMGVTGINVNGPLEAIGVLSLQANTTIQSPSVASTWEIDIWGKLAAAKRSAKAQVEQSQAYYQAIQTQLIESIASAYYALISYDNELQIYEASAKTREESLDVLKAFKEAAKTNEISVNQGAAQYYYTLATIPQIKINIQTTENLIAVLIGKPPMEIKRSTLFNAQFCEVDYLQTGIPAQLLANRPDLVAAEKALISAHEQWNYARAAMYPSLVISGNIGSDATNFANWFSFPKSFVGNLLGGLTAPIFAHRQLKTQRNVAAENKLQAIYNYENTMLAAQREVSDAFITFLLSKESIENQKQQVDELYHAISGSLELLKSGKASYLDLLFAQDNALNSAVGLVRYYLQNTNAKIELYRSLGGGWK